MAGAGYKLFNTGDVLTAAQVNTYLQEQTVMVFASSAARTSALSGVLAEGMVSYLQDTNAVEVYNGSAWVGVSGAGDVTEVQAGTGISVASGTGPIPVVTNTMATAIDAAGDLIYGTGADTFARLGIGTAGQVLKVNSGATAPEWGAAGGGSSGLTLISSTTIGSAVTSVALTNVFSATYTNYKIIISGGSASASSDGNFILGATTSGYYNVGIYSDYATGASPAVYNNNNTANSGTCFAYSSNGYNAQIIIYQPQKSARTGFTYSSSGLYTTGYAWTGGGFVNNSTAYTDITFQTQSGHTLTGGTIKVYGLQD